MVPLVIQALLAVIGLRELRRHVWPALARMETPDLVVQVWGPIVVVIPLLFMVATIESSARGTGGWLAVAAPVACGWFGVGAALVTGSGPPPYARSVITAGPLGPVVWSVCGVVMLLLTAANGLTTWMGQCALAAAAVLLWMNSPPHPGDSPRPEPEPGQVRAGVGLLLALAAAVGQGLMALRAGEAWAPLAGGLMLAWCAMAVTSAAVAGPEVAVRLGAWAASLGVLLALGLAALVKMLPNALAVVSGGQSQAVRGIAYGFAAYAPEAVALVLLGPAGWLAERWHDRPGRWAGAIIIGLVAVRVAWELARSGAG